MPPDNNDPWTSAKHKANMLPFDSNLLGSLKGPGPLPFFFPFLVHRFVVWTVVALSDGNNLPRSSSLMCGDVDQNHVRFHVAARCFRIQKLHLYTLDKNSRQESLSILSSDTVSNILNTIQKPAK